MRFSWILFLLWVPWAQGVSSKKFIQNFDLPANQLSSLGCKRAESYRFIFVTGFLNEVLPYYYQDQTHWLKECRVPATDIFVTHFPSTRSYPDNAQRLAELLTQEVSHRKKFVLVGHSKGAAEILLSALSRPEFFRENVAGILFLQGSFGGSHLADYLLGEGKGIFPILHLAVNEALRTIHSIFRKVETLVGEPIFRGLESVSTRWNDQFWASLSQETTLAFPALSPLMLNLRTIERSHFMTPALFIPSQYLRMAYGEDSDGALSLNNQMLPWKGVETVDYSADHFDTVFPLAMSGSTKGQRVRVLSAFLNAL